MFIQRIHRTGINTCSQGAVSNPPRFNSLFYRITAQSTSSVTDSGGTVCVRYTHTGICGPEEDWGSVSDDIGILYCGSCGALNPRTNHYCSACGHALVDAYHASEGLRIYATADSGAALVDIVDPGSDIVVIETNETLPADFVKISLPDGRIGYVRLREVERVAGDVVPAEPGRREPVGCISSTGLLAIILLAAVVGILAMVIAFQSTDANADFLAVLSCIVVVPFFAVVIGFYLYVRKREDEINAERQAQPPVRQPSNGIESPLD